MLFLFTSPSAKTSSLYMRDLLNACTLPKGAQVRFSYRKDWLSTEAADDGVKAGDDVLVVFAEIKERDAAGKPSKYQYHPVRFGRVKHMEWVGSKSARVFDVELGAYFDHDHNRDAKKDPAEAFQKHVEENKHPLDGTWACKCDDKKDLLRRSDDEKLAGRTLIDHMRNLEGLRHTVFISSTSEFAERGSSHQLAVREYDVYAAMDYEVSFLVVFGPDADRTKRPVMTLSSNLGSVIGPIAWQHPWGEQMNYWISIKRLQQRESGLLTFRVGDGSQFVSSELTWLLHARAARWKLGLALALAVIGTFFSGWSPEQIKDIGFEHPGWWSAVAKAAGVAMLSFGAVLGYKFAASKED